MVEAGAAVAAQLGRTLRAPSEVVATCHLGLPVVIAVPPILDDGTPFPTRYWLTCPLAVRRVARLESAGEIARFERRLTDDPEFAAGLAVANHRYQVERDRLLSATAVHRPRGGVGGTSGGIKCLHAHAADYLAGNENVLGEEVATMIGTLDCQVECVTDGNRNPAWREPR